MGLGEVAGYALKQGVAGGKFKELEFNEWYSLENFSHLMLKLPVENVEAHIVTKGKLTGWYPQYGFFDRDKLVLSKEGYYVIGFYSAECGREEQDLIKGLREKYREKGSYCLNAAEDVVKWSRAQGYRAKVIYSKVPLRMSEREMASIALEVSYSHALAELIKGGALVYVDPALNWCSGKEPPADIYIVTPVPENVIKIKFEKKTGYMGP